MTIDLDVLRARVVVVRRRNGRRVVVPVERIERLPDGKVRILPVDHPRADIMPRVLNMRGRHGVVPPGAVYVGRRVWRGQVQLAASRWANPFEIGRDGTRDEVIAKYRVWLRRQAALIAALA